MRTEKEWEEIIRKETDEERNREFNRMYKSPDDEEEEDEDEGDEEWED